MYLNSAHEASHVIEELAQDVWQRRNFLLSEDRKAFYVPYRMSVSDYANDRDYNFYFHFVVAMNRWWFTVSDQADFNIDQNELVFRENDENRDWDVRCESYRHYAFSDLVAPMVRKKVEDVMNNIEDPRNIYLWDTFPIQNFRGGLKNFA